MAFCDSAEAGMFKLSINIAIDKNLDKHTLTLIDVTPVLTIT